MTANSKPPFAGEVCRVRLGELISPAKVEKCGRRILPILSITKDEGIVLQKEKFKKRVASADVSGYKVVPKGKLVQGIHIDEANFAIQNLVDYGVVSPAYKVWDVDDSLVMPEYLAAVLRSSRCISYYRKMLSGTVHRRGRMSNELFYRLDVPLPSLLKQEESLKMLGSVQRYLVIARRQLSLLDELVKSRFVEMFGDPEASTARWDKRRLDSFTTIVTGNTPSRKNPAHYGEYLEWVKTDNIVDGSVTQAVEWLSEEGAAKARFAPKGTVLMACIAGSVKNIGKVGLLDRDVAFNQQINAVIPSENVEPRFLLTMLSLSKDYLCSDVNMQLKGILNKSSLSAKEFTLPPLSLQREFAAFAAGVAKSQVAVRQQIEKLQTLYDSLAQDYFG